MLHHPRTKDHEGNYPPTTQIFEVVRNIATEFEQGFADVPMRMHIRSSQHKELLVVHRT
ncbi:hypothetical protein CKCBHOJB_01000 [Thauera sp. GDN1]|nr:hypothetical protein CKCBHOJB_01000 [Thauera sp. GDN1]